jgi:hypothetical protein
MGNGGACDVTAQLLKLAALIHGAAHLGVEAESLLIGAALRGTGYLNAGNDL